MIPLALVTGFLGSGKTTFLQQVVQRMRGRRIAYLVNEFSPVDIDGRLLELADGRITTVAGGSIFCKCKVTEFIHHLKRLAENPDNGGGPIEGVVVEASGIADPRVVIQMLEETRLDHLYRPALFVCMVDPAAFLKLIHTLPNIIAQVESADVVLINKIDLYDEATRQQAEREIRKINPSIKIMATTFGQAKLDLFEDKTTRPMQGEYAACADPNYAVLEVPIERPVDVSRLVRELNIYQNIFYRVKGFVPTGADRQVYLDLSTAGLRTQDRLGAPAGGQLVFIVPGDRRDLARAFHARITGGEFNMIA